MSCKVAFVFFALLLAQPSNAVESDLDDAVEEAKNRPVTKVINLLKDMLAQMEKEADVDEKVYDKYMCWCEVNRKETQENIDNLGAMLDSLMGRISEWKATSAELTTEIAQLTKDLAAAESALDTATKLREKALAEYREEEKDMMQAIQALKQAVSVLSQHHGGAFMQQRKNGQLRNVAAMMSVIWEKYGDRFDLNFSPQERDAMTAFTQILTPQADSSLNNFLQGTSGSSSSSAGFLQDYIPNAGSYTARSGQIFGILSQMLETFEKNLKAMRKQEIANEKAFRELKAAKLAEISAINSQLEVKGVELATVNEKLADGLKEKEAIIKAMEGDMAFLKELNGKCRDTNQEYKVRVKAREEEIKAVSEALAVLSGDDAHDLFTRTYNPETSSFLQIQSRADSKRRQQASVMLANAGERYHSGALLSMAIRAKIDAFHKVKDAIKTMISALKKEKQEEIAFRDDCIAGFHQNALKTADKERRKEVALNDIQDLEGQLVALADDKKREEGEIEDKKKEMTNLGAQRDAAHADYQQQVQDQRDTVKVLDDCLQVLRAFYGKDGAFYQKPTSFLQVDQDPDTPTPKPEIKGGNKKNAPSGFTKFKKQNTGVMAMIEGIMRDTKQMEEEITKDEAEDQTAYEKIVVKMQKTIEEKEAIIQEKIEVIAKRKRELIDATKEKQDMLTEIEQLGFEKSDLHNQCDFTLDNFDKRQEARDNEVEALRNAMAILAGANYGSDDAQ